MEHLFEEPCSLYEPEWDDDEEPDQFIGENI